MLVQNMLTERNPNHMVVLNDFHGYLPAGDEVILGA